ncbi:NUDIX domain-containing protein [Candidatus Pacearchaeota archaeon]|nr:NUDIX domain-containing protein [Candidatus Pacearchaeota archaeon]
MKEKQLDIFNERIELIGQKTREEVHKEGHWHRAFHCWILGKDTNGEEYIIFQLRSKDKDLAPNSLDISAAGHLDAGEEPLDGLRELKEELDIGVTSDKLHFLGVHVEVYCDKKAINREFDYVYFLNNNKPLSEYKVQPNEVIGLTKIKVNDGIALFSKEKKKIQGTSIIFNDKGIPEQQEYIQELKIESFAGGERNNYFIKIFLLAKQYFQGETLLFI